MTNLKSLEKLRNKAEICDGKNILSGQIVCQMILDSSDEIQAEIDERYAPLPVDADGKPWTKSDTEFIDEDGYRKDLYEIKYNLKTHKWSLLGSHGLYKCDANHCRHVKPDPVKELLEEFANNGTPTGDGGVLFEAGLIEQYAAKIRKAVES